MAFDALFPHLYVLLIRCSYSAMTVTVSLLHCGARLPMIGVAHQGVQCDVCNRKNLTGMRWKCTRCYDYDLCPLCYMANKHILEHEFTRYDKNHGLK